MNAQDHASDAVDQAHAALGSVAPTAEVHAMAGIAYALASIAISLDRIADAQEATP